VNDGDTTEHVFETRHSPAPPLVLAVPFYLVLIICLAAYYGPGTRGNLTLPERLATIVVAALVGVYAWCGTLARVRIRRSDLVLEYRGWKSEVRYAEIVDIDVVTEIPKRRYVSPVPREVIVLRRRHGRSVTLRGFGDGEVRRPFAELQRRWSTWMDHAHPRWRDTPPEKR
jgi:hypothetical protein